MDQDRPVVAVGIGSSAGGLEALKALLPGLPRGKGFTYVAAQHLDPTHPSMLAEILGQASDLPVIIAADGDVLLADRLYLLPPAHDCIAVRDGTLRLREDVPSTAPRHTIDILLAALAQAYGAQAAGIILSGSGTDGLNGARAIKAAGGVVIAEDPTAAAHPGMPEAVINAHLADLVRPPTEIGVALGDIGERSLARGPANIAVAPKDELQALLDVLVKKTGFDFHQYKEGTVTRRIQRRMAVHKLGQLGDYRALVARSETEGELLLKDIFISVTGFFRDEAMFRALPAVLTSIIERKPADEPVRMWIAGCATGEEAFSIAMLLAETDGKRLAGRQVQIFATDIDDSAIAAARKSIYVAQDVKDIPEALLAKYFIRIDGVYQVGKSLRDKVIFTRHDLMRDPPFRHVDLISCRNVLIYFKRPLQERLIRLFHYGLNPGGVLVLGQSESIGSSTELFEVVDQGAKIFSRDGEAPTLPAAVPVPDLAARVQDARSPALVSSLSLERLFADLLMGGYAPAGVLVNGRMQIEHIRGDVSRFLRLPQGDANLSVMDMLVPALRLEVRLVLQKAQREKVTIRGHGIEIEAPAGICRITPVAIPTPASAVQPPLTLLLFEQQALADIGQKPASPEDDEPAIRLRELEQELAATRDHLQTSIQELETSNEELQSINEEFQSTSEELQSSNEELQTTNEELQSTNEELQTVNDELKAKTEELGAANVDLQNILNTALSGIVVLDRELRVTRYSAASKDVFKLWPTSIGKPLATTESTFDLSILSAEIDQAMKTSRQVDRDLQLGDRLFAIRLIPFREDGDKASGLIIVFQDETEKRLAEADARRLAAVVRDSNDAVTLQTLDGQILSWNRGAERMYGYDEAEALAMNIRKIIPEDRRDEAEARVEATVRGEDSGSFETVRLTRDGQRIDVSLAFTLLRDDRGQPQAIATTERDISKRKHEEQRFRALLDSAPDATIVVNGKGEIELANAQMVELFGYSRDELLGMPVRRLVPKRYQAAHEVHVEEYFAHPHVRPAGQGLEIYGRARDGREFPIDVSLSPIKPNGEMLVSAAIRDITGQKEIEEQLRRSRDELEQRVAERTRELEAKQEQLVQAQKMEVVGQLTGGIAHDFNNLLTAIIGNLERLGAWHEGDERSAKAISQAEEAAELGAQLTSRLLAFSRRQPLDPEVVDLNALVLEMGDLLQRTLGETIHINTTLDPELQKTRTDPGQLQNALLNLCLNARDAMPEGGEMTIETAGKLTIETANVEIDRNAAESHRDVMPGSYVRLSVTDTGIGMPPDVRDRVFEPFFTTKEAGAGTGLGLSMVYGFAKQSGGHVLIDSEPGLGTTVSLYLPRIDDDPCAVDADEEDEASPPARGETVLVVEDDARVRRVTVNRLRELGYQVLEAKDGPAALQRLQQSPGIDLLFTDLVMPGGMTGRQLAGEVRQRRPEIKILYTSGYAGPTGGQAQADLPDEEDAPLLRKPYRREELARKLRDIP